MVISKMNNVLVKHSRILFGLFTAVIIISFVWFFTPGASGNILFGTNPMSPNAVVGSVFEKDITRGELMDMVRDYTLLVAANSGVKPAMNGLDERQIEEAFQRAVLISVAKQMGITVPAERVGEYLRAFPAFAGADGKFSAEKFQTYEKEMLQPLGYNALDLDNAVRNLLTIIALSSAVGNDVVVTRNEVADFERAILEKISVKTVLFPFDAIKKQLNPSEAELQAFHKANPQLFMTLPQFKAKVVRFNYNSYMDQVKLAPDAVKKYYDSHKAEFTKNGKTAPLASVTKQIAEKLKKAEAVKLARKAGRDFREALYDATAEVDAAGYAAAFVQCAAANKLAVAESGWFNAESSGMDNVGREPRLVEAVVNLPERSPITKTVEGERAVFVAVVSDRKAAAPSEYRTVAAKVREAWLNGKAVSTAQEKARSFVLEMNKAKDPAAQLAALAKDAVVKDVPAFSQENPPKENAGIVMSLADKTETGKLSRPVDLPDGVFMIFVSARTAPAAEEIAKQSGKFSESYKQAKQYAVLNSFQAWIMMNTRNYMQRSNQAQ